MTDLLACADGAISDFVRQDVGSPPWPNWAGLQPGDTQNGWGASGPDWRQQARRIISAFERCAGVEIARNDNHLNKLRMKSLTTFRDYLVEQAGVAAAELAVAHAKTSLDIARATAKMTVER